MPFIYIYLLCLLFLVVLGLFLGILIDKGKIGYRSARLIATFTCALTVIPDGLAVGWPFAIGATALGFVVVYYIFLQAEELCKLKRPQQTPCQAFRQPDETLAAHSKESL